MKNIGDFLTRISVFVNKDIQEPDANKGYRQLSKLVSANSALATLVQPIIIMEEPLIINMEVLGVHGSKDLITNAVVMQLNNLALLSDKPHYVVLKIPEAR